MITHPPGATVRPLMDIGPVAETVATGAVMDARTRVQAVDLLRGLVMVVMALDHTRDFVHSAAMAFQPEDLQQTTPAIFMTRWITHFCAPVFMFTAGVGAFLRLERGGTRPALSRFLWTRGLWLIVLEFTVVRAGFFFDLGIDPLILLVFWALGMSMIALALLVYLPYGVLLALSVALIALHNLFDGITAAQFGRLAWTWHAGTRHRTRHSRHPAPYAARRHPAPSPARRHPAPYQAPGTWHRPRHAGTRPRTWHAGTRHVT